jgi:ubiquinone/menaquinone biosynthesis C-methylase UbiE
MLGLTTTEVRSSTWPIFRRWLAERLPRRHRALADSIGGAVRPARARASSAAHVPLLDPIVLRQWIYGPGCVIPGDALYLKELMSPVRPGPEMSLLDLNAGMGGPGIAITQVSKSYIAGFDRNPDLVRAGAAFLRTQKAGRRVQLASYDPENFSLRAGFYDCVMAREMISTLVDKEAFFQAISLGLKSFGQVVITDFVSGDGPATDPGFAGWAAMQERKPLLWAGEDYVACLERLGCNVLIAKDTTADYRSLLLRSWRGFLDHPELRQLRGRRAMPLLDEVERCIRALAAFDGGALRHFYICAQNTRSTVPIR